MSTAALLVVCPRCHKQYQVPPVVAGKKILCKNCQAHIPVPAAQPPAKPAAGQPPVARPGAAKPGVAKPATATPNASPPAEDEWKNFKPYELIKESDLPRCPFCAAEVEEDQVVCLACGFNRRTRDRHDYKMYLPLTGMDWFKWLAPGVLSLLLTLMFIGWFLMIYLHVPYIGGLEWMYFSIENKAWPVYLSLFCLMAIFGLGWFTIRRLILNPRPPLVEKFAHEEEEEEE
jgi:hypothetical protein